MLGLRMVSLHNLRHLHRLMEAARQAIAQDSYAAFAWSFANQRFGGEVPVWFAQALEAGGHQQP